MSASSLTLAKLYGGVCQGSLIKAVEAGPRSSVSSGFLLSSSTPTKVPEYCVLVGVRLTCFESWLCMNHGHPPTAIYSVVGASAISDSTEASFRVVTTQGTHLWYGSPSTRCRDIWLKALSAGLERHFASSKGGTGMKPVKPRYRTEDMRSPPRHCNSCGKLQRHEIPLVHDAHPLPQYGMETRMDLCVNCEVAQGLVAHIQWMEELFTASRQEQEALIKARGAVLKALIPDLTPEGISSTEPTTRIELSSLSHYQLSRALSSPEFMAYARASPTLDRLRIEFSEGLVGCMELVELLEKSIGIKDGAMAKLKQQALRFNGDMGTALKMLVLHALPNPLHEEDDDNTVDQQSTHLLQCIFEFFFDLLEEGELKSVAFFWPQLLNIHLQMLPASNVVSLRRVELMEDFLLTVATQYSVQLAIELIWRHTSDLEDAKTLPFCAKRRSAVLRFLCELESLLFDFEMGWGGGSVTVGQFLGPSEHQIAIMKSGMLAIQSYRLIQPERLSRSNRERKLLRDQEKLEMGEVLSVPAGQLAQEALRVAKNADYLSSHMAFTKRLGDVAYRLFDQPVDRRRPILEAELAKLNASGSMGGDPLNRVKEGSDHTRVVRIPTKEGHVFRSKERTPVLLLVETIDETAEAEIEKAKSLTPFPFRQPMDRDESKTEERRTQAGQLEKEDGEAPELEKTFDNTDHVEHQDAGPPEGADTSGTSKNVNGHKATEEATGKDSVVMDTLHEERSQEATGGGEDGCSSATIEPFIPLDPELRGSQDWLLEDSTPRHALRRFDGPKGHPKSTTLSTDKETVEALLTNVVAKQLHFPPLTEERNGVDRPENGDGEIANVDGEGALTPAEHGSTRGACDLPAKTSKMSALGSVSKTTLSKTGDTRRVVVNALMMKGMSGSHTIATGTAVAMQRHLQDLERRRAVELLLTGPDDKESDLPDDSRRELLKLGIRSISRDDMDSIVSSTETDEDNEAMEAIRLLLIQYHVGQGSLRNGASKSLVPQRLRPVKKRHSEGTMMHFGREFPEIDAGDVDPRLIGCGILPPAVLQALTLRKANMISNGELLELVKKDLEFVRKANQVEAEAQKDKLQEDSAFWGRFAFGERWAEKRSRIAANSPDATKPGWDLNGVIVKANDDLRQEAFVMQLIELCREAFDEAGLELWLLPYRILATGRTTGIIEMVRNAMSFDALKKRPGYGRGGLREHLQRMTQFAADPSEAFKTAQKNFVRSLAGYSLISYLFLFKDRHNGNILLDTAGHVIHIDFGFVFGVAPGGSFSLEISTPFKLTEEMIDVMDGLRSSLFSEFITLFCCGFLALQAHCDTFCTVVEISCRGSTFKCFEGRHSDEIVGKLRERFQPDLGKEESVAFCLDLIKDATQSYGTAQYDYFQYLSQGIAA